jgi:adenylosuccinate synthase
VQDLKHPERFAEKLKELLDLHNFVLTQYLKAQALDYQQVLTRPCATARSSGR